MQNCNILISVLFSLFFSFILGCSGGSSSNDIPPYSGSPTTGTDSSTNVGAVDQTKFYVTTYLDPVTDASAVYDTHVRTLGSFSTACEIDAGSVDQDLICIVDAKEYDLLEQGIKFQYNAPATMCSYLERTPYWYYNWEIGDGPLDILIEPIFDAADEFTHAAVCTVDGVGPLACNSTNFPELGFDLSGSAPKFYCQYNHDSAGREGPNCCLGNYDLLIDEDHSISGNEDDPKFTSNNEWGGDVTACLGGAGKSSWSIVHGGANYTRNGYPATSIEDIGIVGVNKVYTVDKAFPHRNQTISIANFYTTTASPHNHTGYVDLVTTSDKPYFVEPIDDRDGSGVYSGSDSYDFRCLNAAGEVRNRIRVYVRDWDVSAEYNSYIASNGASGDPDTGATGTEIEDPSGVNCNGVYRYCNDGYDSDDFLNIVIGGAYGAITAPNRYKLFPREYYP